MNGYLMLEQTWTPGEDTFFESSSPENAYAVVFEDDGTTAYLYAVQREDPRDGSKFRILDALHIHQVEEGKTETPRPLLIVWSKDWLKCALVIDDHCHALFDFAEQGGYNINEFPPPNSFWTKGDRKLTDERIREYFF